ncbi:hypothetical protein OG943_35685 [Amycolatopsis sp. NBC_00345]|uniref:hypothetical protein n=1 Tax=Amycolatopsis sp. NBC_00345 TaxID=2975955 RepID=UPI002E258F18
MGNNTKRLLCGAVLLGVAAVAVAGCSGIGRPDKLSDGQPVTTPVTAVRVDVPAGGVKLRVEDGAPVSVRREVEYRGKRPGQTQRVEGTTLVLSGCGQDCEVRYDVVVPRALPVSGSLDTGTVTLDRPADVDLRRGTGTTTLTRVTGPVKLDGGTGTAEIGLEKPGVVQASVNTGTLTVSVPQAAYRVDAHVGTGRTDLGVAQDPASPNRLDLRVDTGTITVRTA